jgi:CRP/FNR family transcriptional regulator, cyclic AMP receptor protein
MATVARDHTGSRSSSLADAARASVLLGALSAEELDEVVQAGHGVRAHRGRHVLHAGETTVAVVLRGVAAVRRHTTNGSEVVAELLGPGGACGLTAALGHSDVGADVTALNDVEALLVPERTFRHLVATRPRIAHACLRAMTAQLAEAHRETARFAASSTAARVELRLLELADRWGVDEGGAVHIGLPLTQEELASWARSSRESTARTLQTLRRADIIATGRRELRILDLPRLRARRLHAMADPTIRELLRISRSTPARNGGPGHAHGARGGTPAQDLSGARPGTWAGT